MQNVYYFIGCALVSGTFTFLGGMVDGTLGISAPGPWTFMGLCFACWWSTANSPKNACQITFTNELTVRTT